MLFAILSQARCGEHVCCGKNVCCRVALCLGSAFAAELIAVAKGRLLLEQICPGRMLALVKCVAEQLLVFAASKNIIAMGIAFAVE